MKKFLFVLMGVFAFGVAFAAGENVPTSKSYVDNAMTTKQDNITANDGTARVLTNTGTAGNYDTKGIYDSTGEYATQQSNLVDAATMNAGVQNAINSEFQCIEWADPNDHTSECLLMDVFGDNVRKSPNLFNISKIPQRYQGGNSTSYTTCVNNNDGSITVTASAGNSAINTGRRLSTLAPELVVGKTYMLNFDTTGTQRTMLLYNTAGNTYWDRRTTKTITEQMLNSLVYFYASGSNTTATIKNIQITEGTTATPYVPYGNIYLPAAE